MRAKAFTLVELLVSLGILAVALLALLSLCTSALRTSGKSSHLAAGAAVAQAQLERAIYAAQTDQPAGSYTRFWGEDFPYPARAWSTGTTRVGTTDFRYALYAETLAEVGAAAENNRVKRVEITVWWFGEAKADRQGYGRLATSATRLVNQPSEEP